MFHAIDPTMIHGSNDFQLIIRLTSIKTKRPLIEEFLKRGQSVPISSHLPNLCFLRVKNAPAAARLQMNSDENRAHTKTSYQMSMPEVSGPSVATMSGTLPRSSTSRDWGLKSTKIFIKDRFGILKQKLTFQASALKPIIDKDSHRYHGSTG